MSEIDKKGINDAMVYIGMNNEAVIIAIGYPPEFATPDIYHSQRWHYWAKRCDQFYVNFGPDNKVISIEGRYPPVFDEDEDEDENKDD
jgi:outer membrane protein assembly factor BamE (lipoprotein component of BamABCDE complex)